MASVGAVLGEAVLRPRWLYHRWRGEREHVLHGKAHQGRMAEYERFAKPLPDAVMAATGASRGDAEAALRDVARPDGGPHQAIPPWHDGTAELAALVHALVVLRRPTRVVETGVARGVTSATILAALDRLGHGRLDSLDLPGLGKGYREQVGIAVPAALRERWSLHFGPSAVRLPGILRDGGPVDLFIHDSAHTYRNMRFEFDQAREHLAPGGLIVSDDVCNDALLEFVEDNGWRLVTVRQSKPAPWTYVAVAWPA